MRICLTGGAGYIGVHILLKLIGSNHKVMVLDNFSRSVKATLDKVVSIADKDFIVHEIDLCDNDKTASLLAEFRPEVVLHCAGLKSVSESVAKPTLYYTNNIFSTLSLLKAMDDCDCKKIIFSSSATVYGTPEYLPCDETHPIKPITPYGHTKAMIEQVLLDWANAMPNRTAVVLRYFNPVGAHRSGKFGEIPHGLPNNLMPLIGRVALGYAEKLSIFGDDYETHDGTGVRDYIHVEDVADAHLAAVRYSKDEIGWESFNLGTGKGFSVLEIVKAFEFASKRKIEYQVKDRRTGDIGESFADVTKALQKLNFQARFDLNEMCEDSWRWFRANRDGIS